MLTTADKTDSSSSTSSIPHGHHLADALPKYRGLAKFAEQFESEFHLVEFIIETNGKLRVLDLTRPSAQ